jgi:hypothetical protein
MGSQHCGPSCDPIMRFKHTRFKHTQNKSGSDASCIAAAIFLSSRSIWASRYFGASVSLKLENFQDVT